MRYGVFQPKHCELNGIRFDSKLERTVYVKLLELQRALKGLVIEHQVGACVFPGNDLYPAIHWRIDFRVYSPELGGVVYLEVKGVLDAALDHNVRCLSQFDRLVHNRLILVVPKALITSKAVKLKKLKVPCLAVETLKSNLVCAAKQLQGDQEYQLKLIGE